MAILPVMTFLVWFVLLSGKSGVREDWRDSFLSAALLWGAFVALSSEGLSLIKALNGIVLGIVWGVVLFLSILYGWRYGAFGVGWRALNERFHWESWSPGQRIGLAIVILITGWLLAIALISPPNTNDALQYHLSRVMHWIQGSSLAHYATPIDRQIWMPIWAETAILQLFLLQGSDRLANLVQWGSMMGSLIGVSLIAAKLGVDRWGQLLAIIFCLTLRMGVLQASSAQNDYVTAFWAVCLAYFVLQAHISELSSKRWFLLMLSVGLGIMTKGTFYAYATPFLIGLLFSTLRKKSWRGVVRFALLGALVVVFLNAGIWARNQRTYGFFLGPIDEVRHHANETIGFGPLFSNLIRNATLHLGTPYGIINGTLRQAVAWLHTAVELDVSDPATTLGEEYWVKRSFHEDYAGNPIHFLLILSSPVFIWPGVLHRGADLHAKAVTPGVGVIRDYVLGVITSFLLFALMYKWQRTGSRLQLPFFVLWSPLFGLLTGSWKRSLSWLLMAGLVFSSWQVLLANPSRPLLPVGVVDWSILERSREEVLMVNSPEILPGYLSITQAVQRTGCRQIGLKMDSSDPEYPFWAFLSPSGKEANIQHLDASSTLMVYIDPLFEPCVIICTYCQEQQVKGLDLLSVHPGGFALYADISRIRDQQP